MSVQGFRALVVICLFSNIISLGWEYVFPTSDIYPQIDVMMTEIVGRVDQLYLLGIVAAWGVLMITFFVSLIGLLFLYSWARYLFTASTAASMLLLMLVSWPVVQVPAIFFITYLTAMLEGAIIMVIWTNPLQHRFRGVNPDYL